MGILHSSMQFSRKNGQKRFQPLEVYARCFYLFVDGGTVSPRAIKELWDRQVEEGYTLPSDHKIRIFRSLMRRTFNLLAAEANAGIRSKPSKFIPVFMLINWSYTKGSVKHQDHIDYLMENLCELVQSEEFADVGGEA